MGEKWSSDNKSVLQNVLHDFKSLRALWNYIYLSLYAFVSVYLVLYHADTCGSAVVYTTGGIVTAVFTGYVFSKHLDSRMDASSQPAPLTAPAAGQLNPPQSDEEQENG